MRRIICPALLFPGVHLFVGQHELVEARGRTNVLGKCTVSYMSSVGLDHAMWHLKDVRKRIELG